MTVRSRILADIGARLTQIAPGKIWRLPDGDYACSATITQAKAWQPTPYSIGQLPAIAWQDATAKLEETLFGPPQRWLLKVILGAYVTGGSPAATARAILADMIAAVGSDRTCGGLAEWVWPVRTQFKVGRAGDIFAGILLTLDIVYTPGVGDSCPAQDRYITADGEILTADGEPLTW